MEQAPKELPVLLRKETQRLEHLHAIMDLLIDLKHFLTGTRASLLNGIDHHLAKQGEPYFSTEEFSAVRSVLSHITEVEIATNKMLRSQIVKCISLFDTVKVEELHEHHAHLAYLASSLEKFDHTVLELTKEITVRLAKEYRFIDSAYLNTFIDYFTEFKKEYHLEHALRRLVLDDSFRRYKGELAELLKRMKVARSVPESSRAFITEVETILSGFELLEKFVSSFNPAPNDQKFVIDMDTLMA